MLIKMLIKNRTNVYDFNFHVVFVTKYRKQIFTTDELRNDMKQIINQLAHDRNFTIEHLEAMPDHVHMLISFPPTETPAQVVKALKGASARIWFKKHPETRALLYKNHLWSPSYFISTIGDVSKRIVSEYIESQMERAKRK